MKQVLNTILMRLLYSDSSCGLWYNEQIHKQKKLLIIYNIYIYILTHSSLKIMKGGPHHCLYNKTVIIETNDTYYIRYSASQRNGQN